MNVPPPESHEIRQTIETVAKFVARSGLAVEEVTRQRQSANPRFAFLRDTTSDLYAYYQHCLSLERSSHCLLMDSESGSLLLQQHIDQLDAYVVQSARNLDGHLQNFINEQNKVFNDATSRRSFIADLEDKHSKLIDFRVVRSTIYQAQVSCTTSHVESASELLWNYLASENGEIAVCLSYILVDQANDDNFHIVLHLIHVINDLLNRACRDRYVISRANSAQRIECVLASIIGPVFMRATINAHRNQTNLQCLFNLLEFWKSRSYVRPELLDVIERDIYLRSEDECRNIVRGFWIQAIARNNQKFLEFERQHLEFVKHAERKKADLRLKITTSIDDADHKKHGSGQSNETTRSFTTSSKPKRRSRFDSSPPPPPPIKVSLNEPQSISSEYHKLPAGLMCLLIKTSDCDYKPLNPDDLINLPRPTEFSQKVRKAYAEFQIKCKENSGQQGWEPMGLYEFYRSKMPYICRKARSSRSSSSSTSSSSSSSTSFSEDDFKNETVESPMFVASSSLKQAAPLDPTNKGHQLLQKMGWAGTGLGKQEQGIVEPISGGEVRELNDKYRGVGLESDPFDQFRRARSQKYQQLMSEFASGKHGESISGSYRK